MLVVLSISGSHGYLQLRRLDNDVKSLEEKKQQLSEEVVDVNNQIYGLKTSDAVLEQKAREDLGLAKQNEIVYIFPDGKP